jgi:D-aminopeptidase
MEGNKMEKEEKMIYKLLKDDFETREVEDRTRFTIQGIAKKLKLDLELTKQALANLCEKDGHIHVYDGPRFRYRSKTRQHIENMCEAIMEAKFGC